MEDKIARLSALKQLKKDMVGRAYGKKKKEDDELEDVDNAAEEAAEDSKLQDSVKSAEKEAVEEDESPEAGLKSFMKSRLSKPKLKTKVVVAISRPSMDKKSKR